ncbi:hypothetical protein AN958_11757 [Leucoagaricus sp. SymC.cos]|nr:hypothetical protein AN958_11757 [Leucoagaricus sp. SymC.cos]
MRPDPVAENVLGTMGTIFWTGQLIPQVWKNFRDKKTEGLSPWLMSIWGISSAFLGVYAFLQKLNVPLQIQPQLFGFLALVSWGQTLYYDPLRQTKKCQTVLITVGTMIVVGAMEVLLVFVSRPAYERGVSAPVKLYGILSAVLIAGGLLPQYWEIYVRKEVLGISYTFITIDMLGGLLNDLSLAFASEFDALAASTYTLVIVMDFAIILAALVLNPRARKHRRLEEAANAGTRTLNDAELGTTSTTADNSETREITPVGAPREIDIESKAGLEGTDVIASEKNVDVAVKDEKGETPRVVLPMTADITDASQLRGDSTLGTPTTVVDDSNPLSEKKNAIEGDTLARSGVAASPLEEGDKETKEGRKNKTGNMS